MGSGGHLADVFVCEHHACGGFCVRGKHHIGLVGAYGSHGFFNRDGGEWRSGIAGILLARFQHDFLLRQACHVKDLGPAEAEEAVADDQARLVLRELASHGFHGKRT